MRGASASRNLPWDVNTFAIVAACSSVAKGVIMKFRMLLDWYRILRTHHQWTVFQAVRYAMWLAR